MIVAIHQPEHMPWLGFFDKARQADVLILLDNVQFRKNYFQNRNRIRSHNGESWLTVPVLTKGKTDQLIQDVRINNEGSPRWKEKCLSALLQNYQKARYWSDHEHFFKNLYQKTWDGLADLNQFIIGYLLKILSIPVKIMKASDLACRGTKSELLLNICKKVGAQTYLSGISGKEYLDLNLFAEAHVQVNFQEFHHPVYKQRYEPFIPCLSVVDLILNHGPASLDILKGQGVETMSQVFL